MLVRGKDMLIERGPRLEFARCDLSRSGLHGVAAATVIATGFIVLCGASGLAVFLPGAVAFLAVMMCVLEAREPLRLGLVRPIITLDRRLGVVTCGGLESVARIDELSVAAVERSYGDALAFHGPGVDVTVFEHARDGGLERIMTELRALGVPVPTGPVHDPHRS